MSLMFLQHFRTIQKMVNDNQDDWDQFIDSTLFSTRMKIQMTTKFSPFYLMYHREAKVPTHYYATTSNTSKYIENIDDVKSWLLTVSASLTRHIHCLRSHQFQFCIYGSKTVHSHSKTMSCNVCKFTFPIHKKRESNDYSCTVSI
jgi:hypothetical protein